MIIQYRRVSCDKVLEEKNVDTALDYFYEIVNKGFENTAEKFKNKDFNKK